jgi:hypothetical protein
MASADIDLQTAEQALTILDQLTERQRRKVQDLARRIRPGLTEEDLRSLRDHPELWNDPVFRFEDEQLAALVAARIALKARLDGASLRS